MLDMGMNISFGVTPGRGGLSVWGVPVYDTMEQAIKIHGEANASVTFVPAPQVKNAVIEALEAEIKFIVIPAERVPLRDNLEMLALAQKKKAQVLGPGSLGLISPEKGAIGWLGGSEELAKEIFRAGPIGIVSRSGGQTSTMAWGILRYANAGVSTAIHIGSESPVGLTLAELLPLFEKDKQTKAVVHWAEMGTIIEEEAALLIEQGGFTKPLIVTIVEGLPANTGFSHASNRIVRGRGTIESKIKALKKAGAHIVKYQDVPATVKKILKEVE
jgi:succinyl-CoA synthetase alpha subunit